MPQYNIIYISPDDGTYLWNSHSFDKLGNADNKVLRFSGRDFSEDELKDALADAIEAAKKQFPLDKGPTIKVKEVKVA